jgi:ferrous iron transport protein B
MARASFLMDRFMSKIGLHGGSILPLMSGYACAIPGIMAARTIDNWKERLITILILPLTSCTARLPVYVIMITAFVDDPATQTLLFMLIYLLGTLTAIIVAKILSFFLKEKTNPSFIMELPTYKKPILKTLIIDASSKTKAFVVDAGKIIFAISIILWALASFPKNEEGNVDIENSYVGYVGQTIEPVISPMGFDWKIGIGLITSFAARETFVSTMSTIYGIDDDDDSLKENIAKDYNLLIAISVMVFYVYAAQCMSTFAIVKRETNTWKWPIFMIFYMTMLAYLGSTLVYQVGSAMGYA